MISLFYKTSYFLFSINAEKIYYFLLYFFIPSIVLLVGLIVFTLLYSRYAIDRNNDFRENIENEVNTFLTELIFSNYSAPEMKKKIKEFQRNYGSTIWKDNVNKLCKNNFRI